MHHLDREVGYFREHKVKDKRKRTSPQQAEPQEEATQEPRSQGAENVEVIQT